MKLQITWEDKTGYYGDLEMGDVFSPVGLGGVYMKTDIENYEDDIPTCESIDLAIGETIAFSPAVPVQKLIAKLTVEGV